MNAEEHTPSDCSRAEARRSQILAAASDCFRAHGFHGASISQISKSAGMSAGHIYHYFENKEAIIAAIVGDDLDQLLMLSAQWRAADDVLDAMLAGIEEGVRKKLDGEVAGLKLEILAEASRNAEVARIVHDANKRCDALFRETLVLARSARGLSTDDATISGILEVLSAMFEGLLGRSVRNPDVNSRLIAKSFQAVARELLTGNGFGDAKPA